MEYLLTIKRINYYFGGEVTERIIFNDIVRSKKKKIPKATYNQIKLIQKLGIPYSDDLNLYDCSRIIKDRLAKW